MKHIYTKYKLQLVKETSGKYEVDNKINLPSDVHIILKNIYEIENECEEVMYLITLNTKNIVTGIFEVSRGNLNSSIVHPREVFKRAILNNSSSFILAHNHPSGDPTPSKEDVNITNRIKEGGKLIGIELLDHIIIGENNYFSLKEKGLLI